MKHGGKKMGMISKRIPAFAVAVIAAVMMLGAGVFWTQEVYADSGQLEKIVFDGDSDYGWAHFYTVDGQDGTIGDLNITVLDQNGNEVSADAYDLVIERSWWDQEQEQECSEEMEPPYGIAGADKETGFTEYAARVTAKEGSGYEGAIEGTFYIIDSHSLSFVCADKGFNEFTQRDGWRMCDWFRLSPAQIAKGTWMKHKDGTDLVEGTHYTVTYYTREVEPVDDPGVDREEVLTPKEENKVVDEQGRPAVPTEPGGYLAVFEGIEDGGYYGGDVILVDIGSFIGIEAINNDREELWSDSTASYKLTLPEGIDGDLWLGVGIRGEDDWETLFTGREDQDDFFIYDDETNTLVLNGENIFRETGDRWLSVYAAITGPEGFDDIRAEGFAGAQVREAEERYDLPEDISLLPDWGDWIEDTIHVRIRNANEPEGKDYDLKVTKAEIISQNPEDETVLTLEEKEDGWDLSAREFGRAIVQLTYKDIDGTERTHEFTVNVTDTVYHADIWSGSGVYQGLPGTTFDLEAWAHKDYVCFDEEDPDNRWNEGTEEGLKIQWSIDEGGEFAELSPDTDDPSKAVLTFKPMPQGWDSIGERVRVRVTVTDETTDDPSEERASNDTEFWVKDDFYQIYPAVIDGHINVGESVTLTPQLRHYKMGQKDYDVVENVSFQIDDVDDEAIDVQEKDGVYTFTRKAQWGTGFCVRASFWPEPYRQEETEQWYSFDEMNYEIWFEDGEVTVYDDYHADARLIRSEDLQGLSEDRYRIEYKLGVHQYNKESGEDEWVYEVSEDSGCYSVTEDGLTVNGEKIAGDQKLAEHGGMNIRAQLIIGDETVREEWCWIELAEACSGHVWLEGVVKEPSCTEPGIKERRCRNCGEIRSEEIPAAHVLTKTTAKLATAKTDGNTAYWTCGICGRYFSDENGGTEIDKDSWIIGKKAMTVKTKTVTAKKNKKTVIKTTKAFTVRNAPGTVTYKKTSGEKKITVAKNGKITVKTGLKKGKTYTVKVAVTSAKTAKYAQQSKTVKVKIKIK